MRPAFVVKMGEYGGRAVITVERIAHNLNDSTRYRLVDNDGCALLGRLTAPDGPVHYYSTLPIRAMVVAKRQAGIPSDISDTPGAGGLFFIADAFDGAYFEITNNRYKEVP